MTRLKLHHLIPLVLGLGLGAAALMPTYAQPMMGDMGIHHDGGRRHEQMVKHWEQRQAAMKAKLQLTSAQEPAWNSFVQEMRVTAKPRPQPLEREALAKLTTPERLEKMNAQHEANLTAMQAHIKQRTEATRTFYNQLSAEQQKVFDAETLSMLGRKEKRHD